MSCKFSVYLFCINGDRARAIAIYTVETRWLSAVETRRTRNPVVERSQPSTVNRQPSTVNRQPSTVNRQD
ncbi:hypothetical protein [Anabaena sp. CS-542/02]|uniref:hypothetical protein n=1 Tax=Anabaena sp. CS-542/02 TaxID=3021719 RepID=UPI00232A873F|nr:hypothetical protein [Anabaena sp. CS-542/02]MDB9445273.1 hypothetical protein [Anabaena sp. CS-542/02]